MKMESTLVMEPIHRFTEDVREESVKQMKLALKEENTTPMYYTAGTLCIDLHDSLSVLICISDHEKLTKEECQLAAQLYLKYKTPNHCFYELAQELSQKTR